MKHSSPTRQVHLLHSRPGRCYSLLLVLAALLGSHQASAQSSLSNFTIDNASSAKMYTTTSTTRRAVFSVRFTRPISGTGFADDPYQTRIYRVGGGSFPEGQITGNVTAISNWSYSGNTMFCTATGTVDISYSSTFYSGTYTGLQATYVTGGVITPSARSNTVSFSFVSNPSIPAAITLTNFRVDNATSVNLNSASKSVICSVALSKDPGYTDEFTVAVGGNTGTLFTSTQTSSSAWTLSGTQKICTLSWSATMSTSDFPASSTNLVVVANASPYRIGTGSNSVAINRVADPPSIPCVSDVYVQNVSFSGTKNSGQNLYAGRAVTTTTNGDVVVAANSTGAFVARGEIVLLDGFSAVPTSTFSAYVDGSVCSAARQTPVVKEEESAQQAVSIKLLSQPEATAVTSMETAAVYPNPASDKTNVMLPNDGNAYDLRIYSSFGKEVKHLTLAPGQTAVDVNTLEPGIYNIRASSASGLIKAHFRVVR